jgi:hypothetical protein
VYGENMMSRTRFLEWQKRFKEGGENVNATMIVFFNIRSVIMIEWVPEGQTVNRKYYLEVLTKLRERVRKKRWDLCKKKSCILHQNHALAHNALAVKQFLADKCIPVLQGPLYSPVLAPCDFSLFPKVKSALKGTHLSLSMT